LRVKLIAESSKQREHRAESRGHSAACCQGTSCPPLMQIAGMSFQKCFGDVLGFVDFFPHQSSAKTKPRCGYRVSGLPAACPPFLWRVSMAGSLFSRSLLTFFTIPSFGFIGAKRPGEIWFAPSKHTRMSQVKA